MVILIVEDEEKIVSFLRASLEHQQYTVDVATDGDEAISKLEIRDYDLILLDLMLPKKDGYEVCRKARDMGLQTPILMLTARDLSVDKIKGLDIGADDYLIKPFELDELFARIRALLRREKTVKPVKLTVGDLELNPATQEVKRSGQLIPLGGKEYRILEFLMRNARLVCTRTMINEHVWGFNYLASNSIDVHIKRLRQKIDGKFEKKLIITVHGRGYKIKA